MRGVLIGLGVLACGLVNVCPLRAGVYNLAPPPAGYPPDIVQATSGTPRTFLPELGELRACDDTAPKSKNPPAKSLRAGYLRQVAELEAKQREFGLSPEDRINLGACLIRFGRIDKAIEVLEEALRVVPRDAGCRFLILANLANAYEQRPDLLQRAIETQRDALKAWPSVWAGWGANERYFYCRAETYALRLMQLRQEEQRNVRPGGSLSLDRTVDTLFPGVRFVGPSRRYEAGTLAFDMLVRLPTDDDSLVRQLLLWHPHDNQLYWLYGELLNTRGDVEFAYRVLDELVNGRLGSAPELREHRRVLAQARASTRRAEDTVAQLPEDLKRPSVQVALLWHVAPRGGLAASGIGPVANEMGWAALFTHGVQLEAKAQPPPAAPGGWVPDWRGIGVSFVTGVVVALLGALQWQQWRRRRQPAADSRPEAVGPRRQPVADSR